jgi:hypothetical protein
MLLCIVSVLISLTDAGVARDRVRPSDPEHSPIGWGANGTVSPGGLQDPTIAFGASTFDTHLRTFSNAETTHCPQGIGTLFAVTDQDPQPRGGLFSPSRRNL